MKISVPGMGYLRMSCWLGGVQSLPNCIIITTTLECLVLSRHVCHSSSPHSPPLTEGLGHLKFQCELHCIYEGKDHLRWKQPAKSSLQQLERGHYGVCSMTLGKVLVPFLGFWASPAKLQSGRGCNQVCSLPDSSPLRAEMHSIWELLSIAASVEDRSCLRFDLP